MADKRLSKSEHHTANIWHQHLHWLDLMSRQVNENTARYLARSRDDTRRDKALLKEIQPVRQYAVSTRVPFWITQH